MLNIIVAMLMSQSSSSSSSPGIEAASTANNRLFAVYMLVLIVTAILTALLFISSNKVQEAIKSDADARIAAIGAKSRADKSESDEKIATLQSAAESIKANAAEQIGVLQFQIAEQRERAARAEFQLEALRAAQGPRTITPTQEQILVERLAPFRGRSVRLLIDTRDANNSEVGHFVAGLHQVFGRVGITSLSWSTISPRGGVAPGITFGIGNGTDDIAEAIRVALMTAEVPSMLFSSKVSELPSGELEMIRGAEAPHASASLRRRYRSTSDTPTVVSCPRIERISDIHEL